jgi:hypothetical protein
MRASGLVLSLTIAASSAGYAQEQAEPPDLSWIDRALVGAGEIVLQTGKDDDAVTIDAALRVRASEEVIRDVLRACEVAPEYTPNIVACRRLDSPEASQSELFVQTVKPAFFVPRFEHVFRLDYFPSHVEVHRVSGPIAELDGTWWFIDEADGAVLVVYSLRLRLGLPVPKFFVRGSLRRDVPAILAAVRTRAEDLAGPL